MPKLGMEPIRKAAVINAGLVCIADKGLERMTLEMVAAQAGCSKGVVTYYFKSKQGLVLECLKAFFGYYGPKIAGSIEPGMTPLAMMEQVLLHSLPPLHAIETEQPLDVSPEGGPRQMHIPADSKAKLFIQFFAMAVTDPAAQSVIRDIYGMDMKGIGELIGYGMKTGDFQQGDALDQAYGLLAVIVGLSVFRVTGFMPAGQGDNRSVALAYLQSLLTSR